MARSFKIPDLKDDKGRLVQGARIRARRCDTHTWLDEEVTTDEYGNATFSTLPDDVDAALHATWGGTTTSLKERWFYSHINAVTEGGTGSSDTPTARTNLGLGNVENTAHSTDAHTMTIDGRDVSADGTKLDNVISNTQAITHGISDNQTVTIDGTPVSGEWARFTANGLESLGWVGSTFPASPTDGMMWVHEPTGRKILYTYDLDNTTWVPITSIGTMTLYVSTTGTDDLSHGHASGTDAFLTVQYAIDCIPGLVGGNVTINIGAGTFADAITVQGKNFSANYSISTYGADFDNTALTINSATQGTANSVTYGTITDNGSAWGLRATLESGNTDGIGAEASVLEDTGQNFLTTCRRGMSVKNTTDDTWAKITDVATDIRLVLDTDIMDDGEDYIIGWPEHKGKWITFASDTDTAALQSDVYLILDNDSDTLTIVGKFDAVPTAADTAYISSLQTIITGKITISVGQLGVNFYRLDMDAAIFQITSEASSNSNFYYCDIKSAIVSGKALFLGCFMHKEDDVTCDMRLIFANSKFTQCYFASSLIDGEGLHYGGATSIRGIDVNNGAEVNCAGSAVPALPCVIQNFTPKAGVTNYGIYMRVNAYVAMWHSGTNCHNWIRFCSIGLDAALGSIGQYCIDYTVYEDNDTDTTADAATFATVS